jgi:Protein of unknown function (DUF1501)
MLSVPGPSLRTCQGISRRELLRAGGLGLLGLTLPGLLAAGAHARPSGPRRHPTFGKAKSCLLVFLNGGCSHLDTFDMKPDAPAEIRGEFNPIATNVPGLAICEHLPLLSRQMDKVTVVRSVSHRDNNHPSAVYWMVTGREYPRASGLSEHLSREDHPHLGSALAAVEGTRDRAVPVFVTVPDYIAVNGPIRAGQHASFLGPRYDPLVPHGDPDSPDFQPQDLGLVPAVGPDRMRDRRDLLGAVNGRAAGLGDSPPGRTLDSYYEKAFGVLASGVTRKAFDVATEPEKVRDCYGRNRFGQSILLGRRLIEAGVRLVQVNWIRILEQGWDTHNDNFNALKGRLLPPTDRAFAALLEDLDARGLLDETLVILLGEFGRSPKITAQNAGREHWAPCNSIVLAGAGIPRGRVYGSTDKQAAYPLDHRITPGQLAATIFHALGVDPAAQVTTMLERPWQICEEEPVLDLWA